MMQKNQAQYDLEISEFIHLPNDSNFPQIFKIYPSLCSYTKFLNESDQKLSNFLLCFLKYEIRKD
jgi:hypothetical protein